MIIYRAFSLNASKVQNLRYSIFTKNIFQVSFFCFFLCSNVSTSDNQKYLRKYAAKSLWNCCFLINIFLRVFFNFQSPKKLFPRNISEFQIMNLDWKFNKQFDSFVKIAKTTILLSANQKAERWNFKIISNNAAIAFNPKPVMIYEQISFLNHQLRNLNFLKIPELIS